MTDVNNKAIAGRSLAEWKKLARQDDCFDRMVPSDLRCILAALEPDQTALALVAAAYRDAADACDDYPRAAPEEAEWTRYDEQIAYSKACILASTPADAEAHLTALLRAEYERGKAETQNGERVQHIKRGSSYTVVGRGKVQTDTPLTDYADVVIYRGDDGQVWVRPVSEFEDGRFTLLTQEGR